MGDKDTKSRCLIDKNNCDSNNTYEHTSLTILSQFHGEMGAGMNEVHHCKQRMKECFRIQEVLSQYITTFFYVYS